MSKKVAVWLGKGVAMGLVVAILAAYMFSDSALTLGLFIGLGALELLIYLVSWLRGSAG